MPAHTRAGLTANDGDVARSKTAALISADKVSSTSVYDPRGNHLGRVDTVMIDKTSGKVVYAVLSFGGFLGIGESHYPLPWRELKYDPRQDGYVFSITEERAAAVSRSRRAWARPFKPLLGAHRHAPPPRRAPRGRVD